MDIQSDNFEFFLTLPFDQRFRAKRIPGYRWDPTRRVWAFPRTMAVRNAIAEEFGPEEVSFLDPHGTAECMEEEILRLHEERRKLLQQRIDDTQQLIDREQYLLRIWELAGRHGLPDDDDQDLEQLEVFLDCALSKNSELASLAAEAATLRAQLRECRSELESSLNEKLQLSARATELAKLLDARDDQVGSDYEDTVMSLARRVGGGQVLFESATREFRLDGDGPIRLQNALAATLGQALGEEQTSRVPFAELLERARDARVISMDAFRYCHFIRVQRNLFAHTEVAIESRRVRSALALLAFSLVLQELDRAANGPFGAKA